MSNQGIEQDVTCCGAFIIDLSPKVCYFINVGTITLLCTWDPIPGIVSMRCCNFVTL